MTVAHMESRTLRLTDRHHEARAVYGIFFGTYASAAGRTACRTWTDWYFGIQNRNTHKHNLQSRKPLCLLTHITVYCQLQSKPFGGRQHPLS